ncbi:MAG: ion transporter [Bacteroidetes bacterium]|nr:ion transporter [Bacteroidota bacterium]MDA0898501.1 ion transporter [Bacteroidota bacterium]
MSTSRRRDSLYTIIFEAHTPAGKAFDVALFTTIGISVAAIMLESVPSISAHPGVSQWFNAIELITTLLFTIEYLLRLWCSPKPGSYARSFYGIIDLVSTLPFYLAVLFPATGTFAVIRALRLLRIFRVLKLSRFLVEGNLLWQSLLRSSRKIGVFLFTVVLLCIIMGTIMYTVEGPDNGFSSIPLSIYWAIVTLTTVGYGDIAPGTVLGQLIASAIMIMGYAIIAVPTGIVTVDLTNNHNTKEPTLKTCENCRNSCSKDANYCPECGTEFPLND